jgi:mRNA interferase HicA
VKRQELERHLIDNDCEIVREGANHTIWGNVARDLRTPVPRHRERYRSAPHAPSVDSSGSSRPPAPAEAGRLSVGHAMRMRPKYQRLLPEGRR